MRILSTYTSSYSCNILLHSNRSVLTPAHAATHPSYPCLHIPNCCSRTLSLYSYTLYFHCNWRSLRKSTFSNSTIFYCGWVWSFQSEHWHIAQPAHFCKGNKNINAWSTFCWLRNIYVEEQFQRPLIIRSKCWRNIWGPSLVHKHTYTIASCVWLLSATVPKLCCGYTGRCDRKRRIVVGDRDAISQREVDWKWTT